MENLPWDPREVVLIGDTRHDHEVALAMNADCVLLAHGHHTAERLEATGRPVLHSFTELVAWLQDD
jgi:phosphoglycolate phosphatase